MTAYTKNLPTDRYPRTRESPGFPATSLLVAPALLVVVILFGGGLVLGGGTRHITVINNLIGGNIASPQGEGRGGGLHFEGSSGSTAINNTIRENSASIDARAAA